MFGEPFSHELPGLLWFLTAGEGLDTASRMDFEVEGERRGDGCCLRGRKPVATLDFAVCGGQFLWN